MQNRRKVILVTGCSSGFGLLTAVRLSKAGHLVWATMRDIRKSHLLQAELQRRGTQAKIRALDVTLPATIQNAVKEIYETEERLDVVINNAGFVAGGFFEDFTEAQIRQQMEVNFFGVQNVCREVLPFMRKQRSGRIINISSVAGLSASPCLGAYNASKWALEGFSESLNLELRPFGIDVVLVEPGLYATKIFSDNVLYAKDFDNPQSPYFSFSQAIKRQMGEYLKKFQRDPEHIARLIEHVVQTRQPRLHYISDFSSLVRVLAGKILPSSVYGYVLRKVLYGNA